MCIGKGLSFKGPGLISQGDPWKIEEVDKMKPLSASSTKGTKGLSFKCCRFPCSDEIIFCVGGCFQIERFFLKIVKCFTDY
jgi:hypothetical protein